MQVAVSVLVAACMAEADPALLYEAPYGYAGLAGLPYAYAGLKSAPCVNSANVPVPCAGGVHYIGKREAEADPLLLAGAYPYAGVAAAYPYALGLYGKSAPCVNALNFPVPCAAGKKKREAEADPLILAGGYPYAGLAAYPYAGVAATNAAVGHAIAYTGLGAVHSSLVGVCTNVSGAQVPC